MYPTVYQKIADSARSGTELSLFFFILLTESSTITLPRARGFIKRPKRAQRPVGSKNLLEQRHAIINYESFMNKKKFLVRLHPQNKKGTRQNLKQKPATVR